MGVAATLLTVVPKTSVLAQQEVGDHPTSIKVADLSDAEFNRKWLNDNYRGPQAHRDIISWDGEWDDPTEYVVHRMNHALMLIDTGQKLSNNFRQYITTTMVHPHRADGMSVYVGTALQHIEQWDNGVQRQRMFDQAIEFQALRSEETIENVRTDNDLFMDEWLTKHYDWPLTNG